MTIRDFRKKSFQRKVAKRSPKKLFLIACEGEKTEPNYINDMVESYKRAGKIAIGSRVLIVNHQHTDPAGVLKDLLAHPYFEDAEQRWIVVDRDEVENIKSENGGHTQENFDFAMQESASHNVDVAYSNPCFELWLVLHFEYRDSSSSRVDIQKKALELLKKEKILRVSDKIDDLKAAKGLFMVLGEKRLNTARKNAEKLYCRHGENRDNPSTSVHKLVDAVESLG